MLPAVGPLSLRRVQLPFPLKLGIAPLTGDSALPLLIYSLVDSAIVILVSLYPASCWIPW
ncbi:hypothetical protein ACLK1T_05185 [Escherichia coli]